MSACERLDVQEAVSLTVGVLGCRDREQRSLFAALREIGCQHGKGISGAAGAVASRTGNAGAYERKHLKWRVSQAEVKSGALTNIVSSRRLCGESRPLSALGESCVIWIEKLS